VVNDRELLSKPPLNYLVNLEEIKKQKPWDLDIEGILDSLFMILKKSDSLDLRICGSAAISSALIYRFKVESLFLFEKLRSERKIRETQDPPFLLEMPFRHELSATPIEDLILTLGKIIEELLSESKKEEPSRVIEFEPIYELDPFSVKIKEYLESFRLKLLKTLQKKDGILFSEYVQGLEILEIVRSLLLLLLVATEGLVSLEQIDEDIKIVRKVYNEER
jgi:segregation and condensation protein A